jgi:hypothetical protein
MIREAKYRRENGMAKKYHFVWRGLPFFLILV